MSSVHYMHGLIDGAKAGCRGEKEIRRLLERAWLRYSGYVMLPGETGIERRTLEQWQAVCDVLIQEITGHNRLPDEPPELQRARIHEQASQDDDVARGARG